VRGLRLLCLEPLLATHSLTVVVFQVAGPCELVGAVSREQHATKQQQRTERGACAPQILPTRAHRPAPLLQTQQQFVADGVFYAELNELLTRELAEDGYSGVDVRQTPMRTEIIIRATRTQNVLGECPA